MGMGLSLLVYWGALAATLCIYYFLIKKMHDRACVRIAALICLAIPLALVAGFRNGVGTDYENYAISFEYMVAQPWSEFFLWKMKDYGFKLLIKLLALISDNRIFLFFASSYVTVEIAFFAFYKLRSRMNMMEAIILYYLVIYHPSLNIMRQMLATSVLLLAVAYLMEGKYFNAILANVVAFFFHATAIMGFALIAVALIFSGYFTKQYRINGYSYNKKTTYVYYALVLCGTVLMPILLDLIKYVPGLSSFTKYLSNSVDFGFGTIFNFILLISPMMVLLFDLINQDKDLNMLKNMLFLYLPISIAGYMAAWASRLNMYIISLFVLFIPLMRQKMREIKYEKKRYLLLSNYYWAIILLKYGHEILYLNFHHTFPYFQ